MGSSPDINYPAQPSYGEGMADAMKAQMEQLLGQGEYANMYADAGFAGGNLGDIIAGVEAPIRQNTAQVDTDVLRQTLLGNQTKVVKDPETGKYGIPTGEVVKVEGIAPSARFQMVKLESDKFNASSGGGVFEHQGGEGVRGDYYAPIYGIIDTETGGITKKIGGEKFTNTGTHTQAALDAGKDPAYNKFLARKESVLSDISKEYKNLSAIAEAEGNEVALLEFDFTNPNTGEPLKEGEVVREGDGMIDLLGDKRNVQEFTTRQATEEDVTAGLASEVGESITEATGNRQAGFDADGNFLGLSAMAEDIQRGNLSRQREADLADVERLSSRFQNVMEDYKPGTVTGIQGARDLLEEQKEAMTTGGGAITIPSTDTYAGDIAGQTMDAATVADPLTLKAKTSYDATSVADPMALTAATSYNPSAGVKGDGYTATAGLQGGNIGQDAFRQALMTQATSALDNGLSERELASISNASRARSGMMGRTFDQQGAIDESKALVLENQKRLMENRGFAQSALGQETDIRERDLGRGLQASMQNQAALNRAAEFGASQGMQAQLANQAATNQALSQGLSAGLSQEALAAQQAQAKAMADATASNQASQFGVGAGMQQESQQAQLGQQTSLAQAQMDQQANAFGAQSAQSADVANQRQAQQAAQFGVGAKMDAERANETLRQQGLGNYINAVGNLARIEDQSTLDPFQALLGRAGGGSLQSGQGVFGQAGYGLNSGPQYLNPESGLGYISQMAANEASMYGAQLSADATRDAGMMSMVGSLGGGFLGNEKLLCWVAREVYGSTNPAWLQFRDWLDADSPSWFRNLYINYGERFANWISDKPRIKSIIRKWMNSKIGGK